MRQEEFERRAAEMRARRFTLLATQTAPGKQPDSTKNPQFGTEHSHLKHLSIYQRRRDMVYCAKFGSRRTQSH
jgi:hypothetical protein